MNAHHVRGVPWPNTALNATIPSPGQGTKDAGRPDFDLTHPKDWPTWLLYMHTENGAVEVAKDGTVYWWGGTIHDGIWMGGVFMNGGWRDGLWMGGDWVDGTWFHGDWRGGHFRGGTWMDGVFRAGKFEGLWRGGLWIDGEFNGFRERTIIPPSHLEWKERV